MSVFSVNIINKAYYVTRINYDNWDYSFSRLGEPLKCVFHLLTLNNNNNKNVKTTAAEKNINWLIQYSMDNFYKNESYLLHLYSIFIMLDITFK